MAEGKYTFIGYIGEKYKKQIDNMVYALYGLIPEEIAIVEGK